MGGVPYELVGNIAIFRQGGGPGFAEGVAEIKAVVQYAKQHGIERLLVDARAIHGEPPSLAEQYWAMTEFAAAGRGVVRLALLVRPEFEDKEMYGDAVARARGLELRGFTSEQRALEWLRRFHGYGL